MPQTGQGAGRPSDDGRTIADFSGQWLRHPGIDGFFGSVDLLKDIVGPLLPLSEIAGKRVAEIGAGVGRVVAMLLEAGAAHVTAIEPSAGFAVMQENLAVHGDRVTLINGLGEDIPVGNFDLVVSIGVIDHIPDPLPTLIAARRALAPHGRLLIWVYGREGNRLYLSFARPLRALAKSLPHGPTMALVWALDWPLRAYMQLCRFLPFLPLASYMTGVLGRCDTAARRLTVYDQIHPHFAHYFTRDEVETMLRQAGFTDIELYHRRGYSWTALARR